MTNRAFQEMTGYTDEELQALSFMDITFEEDRSTNQELADDVLRVNDNNSSTRNATGERTAN